MAKITLKGNPVNTNGELPEVGKQAPDFTLVKTDLSTLDSGSDLAGTRVVLNVFPSVDTPTCATSVRQFNEKAGGLENTRVVCASMDLPFALGRFCGSEGLENVEPASAFRSDFASDYGLLIVDGPLTGLCARAVIVLDGDGTVLHSQLVGEIGEEPDYDAALQALQG